MSQKEWEKARKICEFQGIPLKIATIPVLEEEVRKDHPELDEETVRRRARGLYYSPFGFVLFTFSKPVIYLTPNASWGTFLHELGHALAEAEEGEAFTVGRQLVRRTMKVINRMIGI